VPQLSMPLAEGDIVDRADFHRSSV
jgi:hypothetical protein